MTRPTPQWTIFALGMLTGLALKEVFTATRKAVGHRLVHHDVDDTVSYGANMPDSLERREPAPEQGQPRFGGTGAIGVPPAVVMKKPSDA